MQVLVAFRLEGQVGELCHCNLLREDVDHKLQHKLILHINKIEGRQMLQPMVTMYVKNFPAKTCVIFSGGSH
jgi:hypothetical protein